MSSRDSKETSSDCPSQISVQVVASIRIASSPLAGSEPVSVMNSNAFE